MGVVGKQKQRQSLHNTYLQKSFSYTYLNWNLNMIPSSLGLAQRLKEATTPVSSYMDQIALYTWLRKHIEHVFKQWKLKWAIYFQQDSILTERLTNSRVICSIRPGRKKTDALITNKSHKPKHINPKYFHICVLSDANLCSQDLLWINHFCILPLCLNGEALPGLKKKLFLKLDTKTLKSNLDNRDLLWDFTMNWIYRWKRWSYML